jgi:hypothetical protein
LARGASVTCLYSSGIDESEPNLRENLVDLSHSSLPPAMTHGSCVQCQSEKEGDGKRLTWSCSTKSAGPNRVNQELGVAAPFSLAAMTHQHHHTIAVANSWRQRGKSTEGPMEAGRQLQKSKEENMAKQNRRRCSRELLT